MNPADVEAVEQIDRDAAGVFLRGDGHSFDKLWAAQVEAGERDSHVIVQAFARHRITALRAQAPMPAASAEPVEAGRAVLEGRGDGTYAEAEAAIRGLIAVVQGPLPDSSLDAFAWTDGVGWHKPAHRAVMACVKLGAWMSAALSDPTVCDEMKGDIREWFSAGEPMETLGQAMSYYRELAAAPPVKAPMPGEVGDLVERLEKGVPCSGMHEDNETELFLVDDAADTMAEAAALIQSLQHEVERQKVLAGEWFEKYEAVNDTNATLELQLTAAQRVKDEAVADVREYLEAYDWCQIDPVDRGTADTETLRKLVAQHGGKHG